MCVAVYFFQGPTLLMYLSSCLYREWVLEMVEANALIGDIVKSLKRFCGMQ